METIKVGTYSNHATLPEVAQAVAKEFTEMGGRAIPVVGIDGKAFLTEQQAITLPYALIGLDDGQGERSGVIIRKSNMSINDTFVIEMAFQAVKYKFKNGAETPLWAYFDFEKIRDRLFKALIELGEDRDIMFQYVSMDISSDQRGVYIEFTIRQSYEWCSNDDSADGEGQPLILTYNLNGC